MAPYTYYYFLSLTLALGIIWLIFNLLYIRKKGRTLNGRSYKEDSQEYKRLRRFASNGKIAFYSIVGVLILLNLANSIKLLLRLGSPDARFVLLFAPISVVIISIYVFIKTKDTFGNFK